LLIGGGRTPGSTLGEVTRRAASLNDHVVDFYHEDAGLSRRVASFLAEGLERGEAAIVIATPEHRVLFANDLADHGIDVERCRSDGRLQEVDAEALLSAFFTAGALDSHRFDSTVGALVRSAASFPGIRAVGEMVAVLWARGDVLGAIALESEWNALATRYDFRLYCCYRAESVASNVDALARVIDLHSHVLSEPPATEPVTSEGTQSFPPAPTSARAARVFTADVLRGWGLDAELEAASVIVSELSTNAVLHAQTAFELVLSNRAGALRIAVRDASRLVPGALEPATTEATGRGLAIVARLARAWGVEQGPVGKTVWADLALSSS